MSNETEPPDVGSRSRSETAGGAAADAAPASMSSRDAPRARSEDPREEDDRT
jgi:hypothetical protein